jgi:hypothetical protein
LADEQFLEIRNAHTSIAEQIAEKIQKHEPDVDLNAISLRQYLDTSSLVRRIIAFSERLSFEYSPTNFDEEDHQDYISQVLADSASFGITTLGQLDMALGSLGKTYEPYLRAIERPQEEWLVTNSFIVYLLLIRVYPSKYSLKKLVSAGWSKSIAQRVLKGARGAE